MKEIPVRLVIAVVFLLIATGFAAAAFPLGTYVTDIARADVPASFPPGFVAILVGHWEMTFAAPGPMTVTRVEGGPVVVESQYASTQNQIAFYKDKGPLGCDIQERDPRPFVPAGTPATAYSGAYNWTFDGKMLTFTKIADECPGRPVVLTAHPWAKRQ